mgnify:CR=1 FL=1
MGPNVLRGLLLVLLSLLSECSFLGFSLFEEECLLLAVELEVVATTVKTLQSHLRGNTSQDSISYDCDSLTKNISFFHGVSGQDDCSLILESGKNIPKLTTIFWIKTSGWFIKINDFGVRNQADSNRESPLHSSRESFCLMVGLIGKLDILEGLGNHFLFFVRRDALYSRVEN